MKYVIYEHDGIEVPVIFTELTQHSDVGVKFHKPVSGGFVDMEIKTSSADLLYRSGGASDSHHISYSCYGKSTSLRLDSRPEDSAILNHFFK